MQEEYEHHENELWVLLEEAGRDERKKTAKVSLPCL